MKLRRVSSACFLLSLLSGADGCRPRDSEETAVPLDELTRGQRLEGFRVDALYTDARDETMGVRLVHERTGLVFVALTIQSAPQAFLWVDTLPTSDMGEPHTQEHLLLGKGNKGRWVAGLTEMSLADHSAFTMQWRTCYHFHTTAGSDVFWRLFEERLDALLHPDYTDEEIRREVRHLGVARDAASGDLQLEEKGTIYNEMVSSFERPWSRLSRSMETALYGQGHPLSWVSGGLPEAIREMQPSDIRSFHARNYRLGNMGVVAALPKEMLLAETLQQLGAILERLEPPGTEMDPSERAGMPPARGGPEGQVGLVDYPHKNASKPGAVMVTWPPQLEADLQGRLLLELFMSALAGDETTNLYRVFVDTATREMDLDATAVWSSVSDDLGHPVSVGLINVGASHLEPESLERIRERIVQEIDSVARLEDGSEELAEFNRRVRSQLMAFRRELSKVVSTPPGFGFRGTGSHWMRHLDALESSSGFRKSLVMKPEMDAVEAMLSEPGNPWRDLVAGWRLTSSSPHVFASRANPELVDELARDRDARLEVELQALMESYGSEDRQPALERFEQDYGAETAKLEALAALVETPRFLDQPPLTLDPFLDYAVEQLPGGIPLVSSNFETMTGAMMGLALRLDGVTQSELPYLAVLPALLTEVGVIEDGTPVPYDEMKERLRREILALSAYTSTDARSGRVELVLRAAGNDVGESRRALTWITNVLFSPDWRPANVTRLGDVVDQSLSSLRNTMTRREEAWVNDPAGAWRLQDSPLYLATRSFLTREHNAHRLRWLLMDVEDDGNRAAAASFLDSMGPAAAGAGRDQLRQYLTGLRGEKPAGGLSAGLKASLAARRGLQPEARAVIEEAAQDLEQLIGDLPDQTLAADWAYLCRQMRHDLLVRPAQVLEELEALRTGLLKAGNARLFGVASRATHADLKADVGALVARLGKGQAAPSDLAAVPLVKQRLSERDPGAAEPLFVGLVNPNTQSGVHLHSAPAASYADTDEETLTRFLASRLYGGGGAHSMFMRTWSAGLAYSNGLGADPREGRHSYYAERCPELPQTLRFVSGELRDAKPDPALVDYTVAQAFGASRGALRYEARGEAMAADLADGIEPQVVERFLKAILELRDDPQLGGRLFERLEDVSGEVLPGFGPASSEVPGAVYFVIGPEGQLATWEEYLRSVEGPSARLHRLYPRDYWMIWRGDEG